MRIILAFVLAVAAGDVSAGEFSCPADFSGTGAATFYDLMPFNNCALDPGDGMTVAVSSALWEGSAHCGECLWVEGPKGGVLVRITDRCPDCPHDLDLSRQAFDAIADPIAGLAPVTWERVACPVTGNLSFRFQGSNPWWIKVQARNHPHGIAAMSYFDGDTFQPMTRSDDNHFIGLSKDSVSDVEVRITATTGETLTQYIGPIVNDIDIPGTRQFLSCDDVLFHDGFE